MRAIENLIIGNFADAKRSARGASFSRIVDSAMGNHGMSLERAVMVAKFLKGEITWEEYRETINN